ncbi:MAG: hypothetical protein V1806_05590 [Pseudomonadota bacterium]
MNIYLAIDDTDNLESFGTGRMSRILADDLRQRGLIAEFSVTRHQFLVHPDIPYTSHNSDACIAASAPGEDPEAVAQAAVNFLGEHFHAGANPGLCLVRQESVPGELVDFGRRAQREVLDLDEGRALAALPGLITWWGGQTGQGIIGALAGVGLRSTQDDGRYIGLTGIRQIRGVQSVEAILAQAPIAAVISEQGQELDREESVDTEDWVRPSLRQGRIVLLVERDGQRWRPLDKKKKDK